VEMAGISNQFRWGGGQRDGGESSTAQGGSKSPEPGARGSGAAGSTDNGGTDFTSSNPKNLLSAYTALCTSSNLSPLINHMALKFMFRCYYK
jgi:hypothetical protein